MLEWWFAGVRDRLAALAVHRKSAMQGQGMVEYALILVLIAIVVIIILTVVGQHTSDVFSNVNTGLGS
jgi:pilus assembly protein Flp/PilA